MLFVPYHWVVRAYSAVSLTGGAWPHNRSRLRAGVWRRDVSRPGTSTPQSFVRSAVWRRFMSAPTSSVARRAQWAGT